jgi:hypothetical protein
MRALQNNFTSYSSFSNFRNYTIQYLPVPIIDIVAMKITERDRMEKVQILINKVI